MYFLSSAGIFDENFESTFLFASMICSSIVDAFAAKSPEPPSEQKMHPPVDTVPSLLGQVAPLVRDSL